MCTSVVVNRRKTIVGWNLDILNMTYRVRPSDAGVFIEILDEKEGWLPLFGANARGDFVGMPTCWPYDRRSDPKGTADGGTSSEDGMTEPEESILLLDIDLLLQKRTLQELCAIAETRPVRSLPGVTFMAALSDAAGNILHIVPGQGARYYEKPDHAVLTNFSPFKMDAETHPWMGWNRWQKAEAMLQDAADFDVEDCFGLLQEVSQTVCPTVVSMVYDVTERTVYWCENRKWEERNCRKL